MKTRMYVVVLALLVMAFPALADTTIYVGKANNTIQAWSFNGATLTAGGSASCGAVTDLDIDAQNGALYSRGGGIDMADWAVRRWTYAGGSFALNGSVGMYPGATAVGPDGAIYTTNGPGQPDQGFRRYTFSGGTFNQDTMVGNYCSDLAVRADGIIVTVSSIDHASRAWNYAGGSLNHLGLVGNYATKVDIAPDGSIYEGAGQDLTVRRWTYSTSAGWTHTAALSSYVSDLAAGPDSSIYLVATQDQTLRRFAYDGSGTLANLAQMSINAKVLAVDAAGLIYTAGNGVDGDTMLRVWSCSGNVFTQIAAADLGAAGNAIAVIPEPMTMSLLGLGGLALLRKYRRN